MKSPDSTSELASKRRALRLGEGLDQWKRRLVKLRARVLHPKESRDTAAVQARNDALFRTLGVTREQATSRCRAALEELGRSHDPKKSSIHYLAFAALCESGQPIEQILEIGTYRGETTEYLAKLFPSATIYSVELPETDPLIREYHVDPARAAEVRERLGKLPNFVPLRINSFFLPQQGLPKLDLIWLDGGHYYPEIAWDHFYCFHQLADSGWLFSDDIILPDAPLQTDPRFLQAHSLLEYIRERWDDPIELLLKREDPLRALVRPKYVAYTQKQG